jgi:hypothetical protein
MSKSLFDRIRLGSRVTIRIRCGRSRDLIRVTGRALLRGPAGWVLCLNGTSGARPQIATPDNVVSVRN